MLTNHPALTLLSKKHPLSHLLPTKQPVLAVLLSKRPLSQFDAQQHFPTNIRYFKLFQLLRTQQPVLAVLPSKHPLSQLLITQQPMLAVLPTRTISTVCSPTTQRSHYCRRNTHYLTCCPPEQPVRVVLLSKRPLSQFDAQQL